MRIKKFRLALLALAATAVMVSPVSAFADGEDDEPEGTPAGWTYNPGTPAGWTYNPGTPVYPSNDGVSLGEIPAADTTVELATPRIAFKLKPCVILKTC